MLCSWRPWPQLKEKLEIPMAWQKIPNFCAICIFIKFSAKEKVRKCTAKKEKLTWKQ
jgi:hypothetical protein